MFSGKTADAMAVVAFRKHFKMKVSKWGVIGSGG